MLSWYQRPDTGLSNTNRGATPMPASLHGLLRVFQVLHRPGRVLAISVVNRAAGDGLSNTNRGATPMHADAAWATPGFSGAPPSGPRSHPRAGSGLRFALATSHRFASAKQRCPVGRAFIARPPPHPSHRIACEGPSARKTLRGPRSSIGNAFRDWYRISANAIMVRVVYASPRSAEGFFGLPSRTRSCARGAEVAGVKNAAEGAFFRACKGDSSSEARSVDEGASPSPDIVAP